MTRAAVVLAALIVAGCAKATPPPAAPPPPETLEARRASCWDMIQHMTDLGFQDYLKESGQISLTRKQLEVGRSEYADYLEEKGVIRKITFLCLSNMTPEQLQCAKKAAQLETVNACFSE